MTKGMSSSALKTVKNNNSTIKPETDAKTLSEDIPDELIPNKEKFFELVNDIARLSLPTQIEHIICFFTEEK